MRLYRRRTRANFIPEDRIYTVNTATFPLSRIKVGLADSLSGYSSSRITVGEIRNDYAWEAHGSAMTLIPVNDGLDFGENLDKESIRFHFTAVRDTFSVCDLNQQGVIQEIYVYELNKPLDEDYMYIGKEPEIKSGSHIGYAPYSGGDSLSFNFSWISQNA